MPAKLPGSPSPQGLELSRVVFLSGALPYKQQWRRKVARLPSVWILFVNRRALVVDIHRRRFLAYPMNGGFETPYSGGIQDGVHYFALRVYIEDTDFGGVVYHSNYLCYLERARSDLLRVLGIDQRASFQAGHGVYAVAEINIKYCRPARFDDVLVVTTRLLELGGAACTLSQRIQRGAETLTEATVRVAFIGPDGKPRRQPKDWVKRFHDLQPSPQVL